MLNTSVVPAATARRDWLVLDKTRLDFQVSVDV